MSLDGAALPLYGLWLVLLIILLMLGGIYLLVGYWQRRVPRLLRNFPKTFNQLQLDYKRVLSITQRFSADDPLPYGPLMAAINRQLDETANNLVNLKNHYVLIQSTIHRITFQSWKILVGAPFTVVTWFQVSREVKKIEDEIAQINQGIAAIQDQIMEVEGQAWKVALRARQAIEIEKEVRRLMEFLSDHKLSGDAFEEAAAQEEQIIEWLEQIPSYFFVGDDSSISQQAKKEDVCALHDLLNRIEPSLQDLTHTLQGWEERYKILENKLSRSNKQLKNIERMLEYLPSVLVVSEEKSQLQSTKNTLEGLSVTLQKLDVENFDAIEQEIDRCQEIFVDIGVQLREGVQHHKRLVALIDELGKRQRECSEKFSNLVKSQRYPVLLDVSQARFLEINKALSELGSSQKPRPLGEIEADLIKAEELSDRLTELIRQIEKTEEQHATLLDLMDREEVQRGMDLLDEYKQLAAQIAVYHPENWQRGDAASTYLQDILSLQSRHQSDLIHDFSAVIPESRLDELVRKCSALIHDYKLLQARSDRIRTRLEWLKNTEASAQEQYHALRSALSQISWLVNSNDLLRRLAEGDLAKLRREVENIGQELNQPQYGLIEKKARSIRVSMEDALTAANGWLEQLNLDIARRSSILSDLVDRLHEMATLDDPAIVKANKLLAREERRASQTQYTGGIFIDMESLVAELRGRNSVWQEFVAVQQELEEIVAAPLRDAVNHAEKQRSLALTDIAEAKQKFPEQHAWPPCSVSLTDEQKRIDELEKEWKTLKSQPTRAIWAVRKYGELAAGYQEVIGQIARAKQWASQEQKRILDIEAEIERLNNEWKRQEQVFGRDPVAVEQIRRLRMQSSQAVARIKQGWISGSTEDSNLGSYDAVLRSLMEIARALRSAVVPSQSEAGEPVEIRIDRQHEVGKYS